MVPCQTIRHSDARSERVLHEVKSRILVPPIPLLVKRNYFGGQSMGAQRLFAPNEAVFSDDAPKIRLEEETLRGRPAHSPGSG
jgi:hypothetical protein